jgi:hypothetical protein
MVYSWPCYGAAEGICRRQYRRFRIKLHRCPEGEQTIFNRIKGFLDNRIKEIQYPIWI